MYSVYNYPLLYEKIADQQTPTSSLTALQIKTLNESNVNTNEYDDSEKSKLGQLLPLYNNESVAIAYEDNNDVNRYSDNEKHYNFINKVFYVDTESTMMTHAGVNLNLTEHAIYVIQASSVYHHSVGDTTAYIAGKINISPVQIETIHIGEE